MLGYYKEAIELIQKSNGRIEFSDKDLKTITRNLFIEVCEFK